MMSTRLVMQFLLPGIFAGSAIPKKEIVPGVHMPIVNIGTAPFPWSKKGEMPAEIVSEWLKQGFRGVDTALNYFDQKVVGKAIANSGVAREDVFVTTKVFDCDMVDGLWLRNYIEYDLKALGVDYVDLMLIHFPLGLSGSCRRAWKVLEKYVKTGKIKAIGTSSFFPANLKAIMDIATVPIAVNQIEYNVFKHDDPTIAFCDANNISVEAWSPLKASFTNRSVFNDPTVNAIANAHNVSVAQVALRWIVQRGHMLAVLSGNPEHQANDADLWSFRLTDDEMQRLTRLKNNDVGDDKTSSSPPQQVNDADFFEAAIEVTEKHEDITVIDLCTNDAMDSCTACNRTLNFPIATSTPTYLWNVTAKLSGDVTAPTYDVAVAFQENLPRPFHYQIPLGHDFGAACGAVQVRFGVGSKGDRSPLPCPGCYIALTFPDCPSGWMQGELLIEGQFKMGFFMIPGYEPTPNITVNVTVRSNGRRVIDLTSHQRPRRGPASVIV